MRSKRRRRSCWTKPASEIEKVEGRQNYLKRRVDMSTINVHLSTESGTALSSMRSSWQPVRTAQVAWEASLTVISRALDVLVAVVVFFWWFFVIAALAIMLWRWRRGRRPKAAVASSGAEGSP